MKCVCFVGPSSPELCVYKVARPEGTNGGSRTGPNAPWCTKKVARPEGTNELPYWSGCTMVH